MKCKSLEKNKKATLVRVVLNMKIPAFCLKVLSKAKSPQEELNATFIIKSKDLPLSLCVTAALQLPYHFYFW